MLGTTVKILNQLLCSSRKKRTQKKNLIQKHKNKQNKKTKELVKKKVSENQIKLFM